MTKNMADVHFTKMHCGLKSFKKECFFLVKNKQRTLSCFLTCVKFSIHWLCSLLSFSLLCVLDPAMHSGKTNIRHLFYYGELHA